MKPTFMNQNQITYLSHTELNDLEVWLILIELDLVINEMEYLTEDDWFPLCDEIETGEIYRSWFLWPEQEVTPGWEGYDHIINKRIISSNLTRLKSYIDEIKNLRN